MPNAQKTSRLDDLTPEKLDSHLYWQVNEDHSRRNSGHIMEPLTTEEREVEMLIDEVNALANAMRVAESQPEPLMCWTIELDRDPETEDGPAIDVFIANTYEADSGLRQVLDAGGFDAAGHTIRRLPDYVVNPVQA